MRHLAFRFVEHAPTVAASQFVVDPYLDYRHRLDDQLRASLERRNLKIDYDSIKQGYGKWWHAFEKYCKDGNKENKAKLLVHSKGLTNVLKLPNIVIDTDFKEPDNWRRLTFFNVPNKNEAETLQWLSDQFRIHLNIHLPSLVNQSPSYRVRPVFLDACNLHETAFPRIVEDNNLFTSLVGVSLLSQLAMLMKAQFTKQNTFPIDFLAIGASYQQKSLSIQQNLKASLLNVNANQNQSMSSFYSTAYCLIKFLRCLRIECTFENVKSENLQSYEAASISFNGVNGCLAKTSLIGKYLSERLNIQVDNEGEKYPKFAYMCHAELNFNKIYELIRE